MSPDSPPDEPAEYKNRGDLESDVGIRKACRFPRSLLGPCSGIEDREFGFKEGKPCLIVKLNRIVNYRPKVIFKMNVKLLSLFANAVMFCWRPKSKCMKLLVDATNLA